MSKETKEKVADMAVWYAHHMKTLVDQTPDKVMKIQDERQLLKFLVKFCNEMVFLATYIQRDIEKLEGGGFQHIILPNKLEFGEPMKIDN